MLAAFVCMFLLGVATRVGLSTLIGTTVPLPAFDHPNLSSSLKDTAFYFYHTLYFATPSRLCNFFAGVLLASFLQSSTYRQMISSRTARNIVNVLVIASLGAAFVAYKNLLVAIEYDDMEMSEWKFSNAWAAWVLHGSPALSVVFALVVLLAVTADRRVEEISSTLPCKIVTWIHYLSKVRRVRHCEFVFRDKIFCWMQSSYGVYLIHPVVFYWNQYVMDKKLMPICAKNRLGCLFAMFTAGYAGSVLVVALVSFFWGWLLSTALKLRRKAPPVPVRARSWVPNWHRSQNVIRNVFEKSNKIQ